MLLLSHFLVFELHRGAAGGVRGEEERSIKAVGERHINEHITRYLQPGKICKIVVVEAGAAVGEFGQSGVEFGVQVAVAVAVGAANH